MRPLARLSIKFIKYIDSLAKDDRSTSEKKINNGAMIGARRTLVRLKFKSTNLRLSVTKYRS
jgi:hypothetical protein